MSTGIGFSQILVILILIVIFVEPKHIPGFIRKSLKIYRQMRAELKNLFNDVK